MQRITFLLTLGGLLVSCSSGSDPAREVCGNGKDDDQNGFTDCQDFDCAGQAECPISSLDGGRFGTCTRCGEVCTRQSECLKDRFVDDTPIPECVGGRCQRLNTNIQIGFELDTGFWAAYTQRLRSMNSRMVSKLAIDGSSVSCATLEAAASGKTQADADQIEKNGKFNLRGLDVITLDTLGGGIIKNPFFNVGTGTNFLIWTELWGGPRDGVNTKLPTGNRYGWGCFESGPAVADLVESDTCSPLDGGSSTCRTIRVKIPGP